MKCFLFPAVALLAAVSFAQEFHLGSAVSDFSVQDLRGDPVEFASLRGDLTVVMFISTQCPISNDYNERMKEIYNDYAAKGVRFVFINSNTNESAAQVRTHAAAQSFPFAVYKDASNIVADRFGAEVTPEAFVIDAAGVIRYHGYIDDSRNPARITVQGLRNALDALQAGQNITAAETKAFGCTIKRVKKAS